MRRELLTGHLNLPGVWLCDWVGARQIDSLSVLTLLSAASARPDTVGSKGRNIFKFLPAAAVCLLPQPATIKFSATFHGVSWASDWDQSDCEYSALKSSQNSAQMRSIFTAWGLALYLIVVWYFRNFAFSDGTIKEVSWDSEGFSLQFPDSHGSYNGQSERKSQGGELLISYLLTKRLSVLGRRQQESSARVRVERC